MEIYCGMLPSRTICLKSTWNRFHWITTWKAPCTKIVPGAHGPLLTAEGPFPPCTTRPISIFLIATPSHLPEKSCLWPLCCFVEHPLCNSASLLRALKRHLQPCFSQKPDYPQCRVSHQLPSDLAHRSQRVLERITPGSAAGSLKHPKVGPPLASCLPLQRGYDPWLGSTAQVCTSGRTRFLHLGLNFSTTLLGCSTEAAWGQGNGNQGWARAARAPCPWGSLASGAAIVPLTNTNGFPGSVHPHKRQGRPRLISYGVCQSVRQGRSPTGCFAGGEWRH